MTSQRAETKRNPRNRKTSTTARSPRSLKRRRERKARRARSDRLHLLQTPIHLNHPHQVPRNLSAQNPRRLGCEETNDLHYSATTYCFLNLDRTGTRKRKRRPRKPRKIKIKISRKPQSKQQPEKRRRPTRPKRKQRRDRRRKSERNWQRESRHSSINCHVFELSIIIFYCVYSVRPCQRSMERSIKL